MGTRHFNILDSLIAQWRLRKIVPYISKTDTILDFGCGHQAFFLNHVKNHIKEGFGIDYEVNDFHKGNLHLQRFHFEDKLPFQSNTFDKIFLLAVIEHIKLPSIKNLVSELYRVLKQRGLFILTTPTPESKPILEFLAGTLRIISAAEIADHKKYYSKMDLVRTFGFFKRFELVRYNFFQFGFNSLAVFQKNE